MSVIRAQFLFLAGSLFLLAPQAFAEPALAPDLAAKVPVRFEQSRADGQWVARGLGYAVSIQSHGTLFPVGDRALVLRFDNADPSAPFAGAKPSATQNVYFGRETYTSQAYLELRRTGIYPGIDLRYYGNGSGLEYDFVLAPGADPSPIRMRFEGADRTELTAEGHLRLTIGSEQVTQQAPAVYQRGPQGELIRIASSYYPEDGGAWSIRLGAYDRTVQLVIDPTVLFTTYFAGSGADAPLSIGRDAAGTIYLAGYTLSLDFPQIGNIYPVFKESPNRHVFLAKINPLATGDAVLPYSGFFGGTFGDTLKDMAVDPRGIFYITGYTDDFFFPDTPNAFRTDNGETRRAFFSTIDTRLSGAASLTYSTFFGGHENDSTDPNVVGSQFDEPVGIATRNGRAYIVGIARTEYFAVKNPIQDKRKGDPTTGRDLFLAEFDPSLSGAASLVNATYFGGSGQDLPRSIDVDPAGRVVVAGYTYSGDYPTTQNALKPFYSGAGDGFVTRFNLSAASFDYSTYLGTVDLDQAHKVRVDQRNGLIAVAGLTLSNAFPVTANAAQPSAGGGGDAFLTVIFADATDFTSGLVYSTYYGGNDGEVPYDLRLGADGAYYMVGYTLSRNLPIRDALRPRSAIAGTDGFVAIIDPNLPTAQGLLYSSFVTGGGYQIATNIEVDADLNIHVAGESFGNIFDPGQAEATAATNANVFFFTFRPSEGVRRQAAPAAGRPASSQRR